MPSSTATSTAQAAIDLGDRRQPEAVVDVADGADDRAVGGDDGGRDVRRPATSTISSSARTVAGSVRRGRCVRIELGDAEREVEALAAVEPRVAHRLVAVVELGVEDLVGAAEALGDVRRR